MIKSTKGEKNKLNSNLNKLLRENWSKTQISWEFFQDFLNEKFQVKSRTRSENFKKLSREFSRNNWLHGMRRYNWNTENILHYAGLWSKVRKEYHRALYSLWWTVRYCEEESIFCRKRSVQGAQGPRVAGVVFLKRSCTRYISRVSFPFLFLDFWREKLCEFFYALCFVWRLLQRQKMIKYLLFPKMDLVSSYKSW